LTPAEHPHCIVGFDYHDTRVRDIILRIKEFPDTTTCDALCSVLSEKIQYGIWEDQLYSAQYSRIYLVPVPARHERIRRYGFNQSLVIARSLAKSLPNATVFNCISRTRTSAKQAFLSKQERHDNTRGAFALSKPLPDVRAYYIIVDDVITTGSTITEIMGLLQKSGGPCGAATLAWNQQ
jgi:ComF family protein